MSRIRLNPRHLIEGCFIFEVNLGDTSWEPRLCYKYTTGKSLNIKEIGRFCMPYGTRDVGNQEQSFTFTFTDEAGFLQFGICLQMAGEDPRDLVCLISNYPWHACFGSVVRVVAHLRKSPEWERLLEDLFAQIGEKDNEYRFGQMRKEWVKVKLRKTHSPTCKDYLKFEFRCPDDSTFPALATDTATVFDLCDMLGDSNMIKLFAAVLMERRIIVASQKLSNVSNIILTIDQLLYPFAWQHTYIPIMPSHVKEVCCAMMPYLIGIHKSLESDVLEIIEEDGGDLVVLDLDQKVVKSPFCDEKRLPGELSTYLSSVMNGSYSSVKAATKSIVEAFANLFVALVGHYEDHLHSDGKSNQIYLNEETFLQAAPDQYKPFLHDLMGTQQFQQFVGERCESRRKGSKAPLSGTLFEQLLNRQDIKSILAMNRSKTSKVKKLKKKDRRGNAAQGITSSQGPAVIPLRRASSALLALSSNSNSRTSQLEPLQEPNTYLEYISLVIVQMENTCRELEDTLAAQVEKDRVTSGAMAESKFRFKSFFESLSRSVNGIPVSPLNQKILSRCEKVGDFLDEGDMLGKAVNALCKKQSLQNTSAIHGIANLKSHWASEQLKDETIRAMDATESGPSDKVIEYLHWMLVEAEHLGQQHELANDRRDICVAETNRIMASLQRDFDKTTPGSSKQRILSDGVVPEDSVVDVKPDIVACDYVIEVQTKVFKGTAVSLLLQAHGDQGDSDMIALIESTSNHVPFLAQQTDLFEVEMPFLGRLNSITISAEFESDHSTPISRVQSEVPDEVVYADISDSFNNHTQDQHFQPKSESVVSKDDQVVYASIKPIGNEVNETGLERQPSSDSLRRREWSSTPSIMSTFSLDENDNFEAQTPVRLLPLDLAEVDRGHVLELGRISISTDGQRTEFQCSQPFSRQVGVVHVFHSFNHGQGSRKRMQRRSAPLPVSQDEVSPVVQHAGGIRKDDAGADDYMSPQKVHRLQTTIGYRGVGASSVKKMQRHRTEDQNSDALLASSRQIWKRLSFEDDKKTIQDPHSDDNSENDSDSKSLADPESSMKNTSALSRESQSLPLDLPNTPSDDSTPKFNLHVEDGTGNITEMKNVKLVSQSVEQLGLSPSTPAKKGHLRTRRKTENKIESKSRTIKIKAELRRSSLQQSYGLGIGTTSGNQTVVTKVTPGGLADGKLCPGDVLISINDRPLNVSHNEVISILSMFETAIFVVARNPSDISHEFVAVKPLTDTERVYKRAQELTGNGMRITYNNIKTTLIEEFGEKLWNESRDRVRTMLEQMMDPTSPIPGRGNPELSTELILERAALLAGNIPYAKLRKALIEEFTLVTWDRAKAQIRKMVQQAEASQKSNRFANATEAREFAFKKIKEAYKDPSKPPTYLSIKDKLKCELGTGFWHEIRDDIEHLLRIICGEG